VNEIVASIPRFGLKFLALLGNLIYVVIIPILAFLCLKDGPLMKAHIMSLMEPDRSGNCWTTFSPTWIWCWRITCARSSCCRATTFTCYSIFLTIVGVQYGILLGVLAGLLEFIPVVGPLAAGIMVLLVGGAASGHWIALLIFLVVFRMFQDYVVSPHLMGQGVELHPLLVLFGVFAGAELAGVAGSFLSVPVLALARVLYRRVYQARQEASGGETGGVRCGAGTVPAGSKTHDDTNAPRCSSLGVSCRLRVVRHVELVSRVLRRDRLQEPLRLWYCESLMGMASRIRFAAVRFPCCA
jgi:hypothetical protein